MQPKGMNAQQCPPTARQPRQRRAWMTDAAETIPQAAFSALGATRR